LSLQSARLVHAKLNSVRRCHEQAARSCKGNGRHEGLHPDRTITEGLWQPMLWKLDPEKASLRGWRKREKRLANCLENDLFSDSSICTLANPSTISMVENTTEPREKRVLKKHLA
jgi:hypothetical protein